MDSERYSRQSALFNEEEQSRLWNSTVVIVGCGGLGSQVIANLVSVGIGSFVLVDHDVVEESNLNRQFIHFGRLGHHKVDSAEEWILNAQPKASVEKHKCMLDAENADGIVSEGDIVIDCLDSVSSRYVLAQSCRRMGRTLIHGGVEGTFGQVMSFLPDSQITLESVVRGEDGPHASYAPAVSLIGSLMADEAVSMILGRSGGGVLVTAEVSSRTMERRPLGRNKNL